MLLKPKNTESKLFDLFSNEPVHFQHGYHFLSLLPMTLLTLPLKFVNGPPLFRVRQNKVSKLQKKVLKSLILHQNNPFAVRNLVLNFCLSRIRS